MNTSPTNRELVEAAAKAAGIEVDCWLDEDPRAVTSVGLWNPIVNSGDALELAVKLDLSSLVIWNHESGCKRREWWSPNSGHDGGKSATTEADYATDPYAATRLAITRAAASIGKEMK